MSVTLVSVTPDADKTIGYIARVSNPNNQDNPKVAGLLTRAMYPIVFSASGVTDTKVTLIYD